MGSRDIEYKIQRCPCRNCSNFSRIPKYMDEEGEVHRNVAGNKNNVNTINTSEPTKYHTERSNPFCYNPTNDTLTPVSNRHATKSQKSCARCDFLLEKAKKYICKIVSRDFVVDYNCECKKRDRIFQCHKVCESPKIYILFPRCCDNENNTESDKIDTNLLVKLGQNNKSFSENYSLDKYFREHPVSDSNVKFKNIDRPELNQDIAKFFESTDQFAQFSLNYRKLKDEGESFKNIIAINQTQNTDKLKSNQNYKLIRPEKEIDRSKDIVLKEDIGKIYNKNNLQFSSDKRLLPDKSKRHFVLNATYKTSLKSNMNKTVLNHTKKCNVVRLNSLDNKNKSQIVKGKRTKKDIERVEKLSPSRSGITRNCNVKDIKVETGKEQKRITSKISKIKTGKKKVRQRQFNNIIAIEKVFNDCDICSAKVNKRTKRNQLKPLEDGESSDISDIERSVNKDWMTSSKGDIKRDGEMNDEKEMIVKHTIISQQDYVKLNRNKIDFDVNDPANFKILFNFKAESWPSLESEDDTTQGTTTIISQASKKHTLHPTNSLNTKQCPGRIKYALSDEKFIKNGWTLLPSEKILQKRCLFLARPAHPEFDWFKYNKTKGLILYDTGEKFAEFKKDGHCFLYYRNGKLAVDQHYDPKGDHSEQRIIVYSSGEPDERGLRGPVTVLAVFDYIGNGAVLDHAGNLRLKYNQIEGVLLDKSLGSLSTWKWNSLNDTQQEQRVYLEKELQPKDPVISKLGQTKSSTTTFFKTHNKSTHSIPMSIELGNCVKNIPKIGNALFKQFPIKMKAIKMNKNFSLHISDQTFIKLIFRDGERRFKINLGVKLDVTKAIDEIIEDMSEVNSIHVWPPIDLKEKYVIQNIVMQAREYEQAYQDRQLRINPLFKKTLKDSIIK